MSMLLALCSPMQFTSLSWRLPGAAELARELGSRCGRPIDIGEPDLDQHAAEEPQPVVYSAATQLFAPHGTGALPGGDPRG